MFQNIKHVHDVDHIQFFNKFFFSAFKHLFYLLMLVPQEIVKLLTYSQIGREAEQNLLFKA
jgi:hypothetical protein